MYKHLLREYENWKRSLSVLNILMIELMTLERMDSRFYSRWDTSVIDEAIQLAVRCWEVLEGRSLVIDNNTFPLKWKAGQILGTGATQRYYRRLVVAHSIATLLAEVYLLTGSYLRHCYVSGLTESSYLCIKLLQIVSCWDWTLLGFSPGGQWTCSVCWLGFT